MKLSAGLVRLSAPHQPPPMMTRPGPASGYGGRTLFGIARVASVLLEEEGGGGGGRLTTAHFSLAWPQPPPVSSGIISAVAMLRRILSLYWHCSVVAKEEHSLLVLLEWLATSGWRLEAKL